MTEIYLIERDFGKLGKEITGYPEHTRRKVIDLIAKGEWPELTRVIKLGEPPMWWSESGVWQDVTEDIAHEVLTQLLDEDFGRMSAPVRAFLETHVPDDVAECVKEYREANSQFGVGA